MQNKAIQTLVFVLVLTLSSSCLRTRSQVRDTPQDTQNEIEGNIQPVSSQDDYVIEEMKSEIVRLTGRISLLEQSANGDPTQPGDEEARKKELTSLKDRMAEIENTQVMILTKLRKLEGRVPTPEATSYYQKGKKLYQQKKYEAAIESLTEYLNTKDKKYPQSATYYRAESYYATKQYKKAIIDFSRFPEEFKKSRRLPEALYKIGLSFEGLGMKNDAKAFYQELVDNFPKSKQAKKARRKLKKK